MQGRGHRSEVVGSHQYKPTTDDVSFFFFFTSSILQMTNHRNTAITFSVCIHVQNERHRWATEKTKNKEKVHKLFHAVLLRKERLLERLRCHKNPISMLRTVMQIQHYTKPTCHRTPHHECTKYTNKGTRLMMTKYLPPPPPHTHTHYSSGSPVI